MQILKKLAAPVLFLLLFFLLIEFSYRFYVLGVTGLNPFKTNSMNTLMRSEYVQLAQNPDIFYELKPDMQGWFKGVPFWTNADGLPDKDYARIKPADTFRIAVAGSSWEMPSGVPPDKAWHAVLEEQLNADSKSPRVEVLNFGVEMYGLREIVATVRHKIMDWHPDMIIVAITTYTTSLVWDPADNAQTLPKRAYPGLISFSWLALENILNKQRGILPTPDRQILDNGQIPERIGQIYRAFDELGQISKETGIPIVIMFEDFFPFPSQIEEDFGNKVREAGLQPVFANHVFPEDIEQRSRYLVSPFDPHPTEAGHVLIADFAGNALLTQGLLPRH